MNNREKIISAIEKAKKQSEEYALDRIIVPFKETDMILTLLKKQEPKYVICQGECSSRGGHKYETGECPGCGRTIVKEQNDPNEMFCKFCGKAVKWE